MLMGRAVAGLVGDIVVGDIGRLAILSGVDPEYGEVAGVAGPHPVVGISTIFSDCTRRSSYQAHVLVGLGDDHIIFIPVVERLDLRRMSFFDRFNLGFQFGDALGHQGWPACWGRFFHQCPSGPFWSHLRSGRLNVAVRPGLTSSSLWFLAQKPFFR